MNPSPCSIPLFHLPLFPLEIIDSHSLSFAITELIEKGLKLADQGIDVTEIANKLRNEAKQTRNLILLGSLEQLHKGGRMSNVQFLIGNFLKIKPILSINSDGELHLFERIRSEKKAIELKERLQSEIPELKAVIGEISSSLAVHAGEDSIALFWHQSEK